MSKTYSVYTLRTADGKVYVGMTSQEVMRRWNNGNGYRFLPSLWEVINRDGWQSVEKRVWANGLTLEAASVLEQELIDRFQATSEQHGYNHELGGFCRFKRVSMASRNLMRQAKTGEKNHNYGKHLSEEYKRKISESNKGLKRTRETRIRVGLAKRKSVLQFSVSGELLAEWVSGKEAAIKTGTQAGHISKVCKHQRATAGGYVWAYATK